MKRLPFWDPQTREDILDHIRGYVFDRAALSMNDESMRGRLCPSWVQREPARVHCLKRRSARHADRLPT
ncbi:MAG: hypothetical protein ACREQ5_14995 [Candidatus Dormibacteria bacterium]